MALAIFVHRYYVSDTFSSTHHFSIHPYHF
jgi:hypothetical protein